MNTVRTILLCTALTALGAGVAVGQTAIGWGNLQWPFEMTDPGCANTGVFGQVWMEGVTDNPGQGVGITAELGFGPIDSTPDGSWEWMPATYNTDAGNNDEYVVWMTSYLPFGEYDYTYRYKYAGDPDWYYAAERGIANFTTPCGPVADEAMSWSALKSLY